MAVRIISEDREIRCKQCKVGVSYNTTDEQQAFDRNYLFIECPRCKSDIITTKFNN